MTDGEIVLAAVGGQTMFLTVLGFLGRSLAGHWLDKNLETFKGNLKAAAEERIAALTHNLEVKKLEHEIRFSKLHEQRANIIAKAYELLTRFYGSSAFFLSRLSLAGEPPRAEKLLQARTYAREFFLYFDQNRIWLPADICTQIDSFVMDIEVVVETLGIYEEIDRDESLPAHIRHEHAEDLRKASEAFKYGIPRAKASLEMELRKLLGDAPSAFDRPAPIP